MEVQNGNSLSNLFGDRFQPTAISISGNTITLAAISHGPDDPLCCPTVESNLTYHLISDQLVDPAQEAAGLYKGFFIAASSPGWDSTLSLNIDQTVRLETDYLNDEPPLVEVGTWAITAAGLIDVTLTGQVDRPYDQPAGFTATLTDGILTVADAPPGAIVDSWIEISSLALGQQPVPYNPTKLDQLMADHGFIGLYKTYLPSASCCGRDWYSPSYNTRSNIMSTDAIRNLITSLTNQNGQARKHARDQLVEIGQPAISSLLPLLLDNQTSVRWEAAKVLSEIGDPGAAPALVKTLEDNDPGIRWMAAEGLILAEQASLPPLLEALLEHSESIWLREGATHVLRILAKNEKLPPQAEPVLQALHGAASDIGTLRAAKIALETMG